MSLSTSRISTSSILLRCTSSTVIEGQPLKWARDSTEESLRGHGEKDTNAFVVSHRFATRRNEVPASVSVPVVRGQERVEFSEVLQVSQASQTI